VQPTEQHRPRWQQDQQAINGGEHAFTASPLPAENFIHNTQHHDEDEVHQNEHPVLFAAGAATKSNVVAQYF
jgi:hypothetical protein